MFTRFGKRRQVSTQEAPPALTLDEVLLLPRPSDTLLMWARDGRLGDVLPDLEALRGVSQLPAHRDDAFFHTLKVVDAIAPIPVRRWAALLHDIGKGPTFIETPEGRSRFFEHDRIGTEMAGEIMEAAGQSLELTQNVQRLVSLHMRPIAYTTEWTDGAVRRLVEEAEDEVGPDGWYDLLALSRADLHGYLPEPIDRGLWVLDSLEARWRTIKAADDAAATLVEHQPRSPLDGHEIIALAAWEPGSWVADAKAYLTAQVAAGAIAQDDKESAHAFLRGWLDEKQAT